MTEASVTEALAAITRALAVNARRFALVGGLAVSARGEVRFTRDVDIAVAVDGDPDAEALVHALRGLGYQPIASVEHDVRNRLSTVRLMSPQGVKVDLLFASCGIEPEIVARATNIDLPALGEVPVARVEDLVAMKVLAMSDQRLQDRIDATRLLQIAEVDLDEVRSALSLIAERGYDRDQDLLAKLTSLSASARL